MKKKLKILISAYACRPNEGSEPSVGWNWIKQISKSNKVWALTRKNNQEYIEKEYIPNVHWIYINIPKIERYSHYFLWQIKAYFVAKKLHKEINFDLVHHLTYVNYWMPTFLSLLPIPFVWGPVGGGESAPKSFFKTFTLKNKIYEYSRLLARWLGEHNLFTKIAAKRAKIALATTKETAEKLKKLGCKNIKIQTQALMNSNEIKNFRTLPSSKTNPFKILSIGRLLHWKGFHLSLMAFAKFQKEFPKSEYWIIGDGPEYKRLEKLANKLNIKVQFLGNIPRKKLLDKLRKCNFLIHPSLHDSGGFVCLEAMAAKCPVICLDLGGPGVLVTKETGIKISAINYEQTINDLSKAMLQLANDMNLCNSMGNAGHKRVIEYLNLENKQKWLKELYGKISK